MKDSFSITRTDHDKGGALILKIAGQDAEAKMTFSQAGETRRIVDHTEVDEGLRGTGAGEALAERMVAEARKDRVQLVPLCPFFLAMSKKHTDWHDVVLMPGASNGLS